MTNNARSYILVTFVCNSAKQQRNKIQSVLTLERRNSIIIITVVLQNGQKTGVRIYFVNRLFHRPHSMFKSDMQHQKMLVNILYTNISNCLMESWSLPGNALACLGGRGCSLSHEQGHRVIWGNSEQQKKRKKKKAKWRTVHWRCRVLLCCSLSQNKWPEQREAQRWATLNMLSKK